MGMNTILETKNLSIGYEKPLYSDINLSINTGELIGIIGKNGTGKSTFLKSIMQIIPSITGEILIENQNLKSINNKELSQKIAVVLTEKIPISQYTVYDILALARYPYSNWLFQLNNKDKEIIENVIELVKIQEFVNLKVSNLSDGMMQIVMIARALVQDTPIIILDEPTTFLDLENTFQIFELLKKIVNTHQKTVIFSTHQVEIALQICDQIICFTNSKVLIQNPTEIIENQIIENIFNTQKIKFNPRLMKFEFKF
jgi:iron complex transport system ATP-binding protein